MHLSMSVSIPKNPSANLKTTVGRRLGVIEHPWNKHETSKVSYFDGVQVHLHMLVLVWVSTSRCAIHNQYHQI